MKRIFITGCARSGTTLMNRLFYAFQDTTVINHEIAIDDFCQVRPKSNVLVGKRVPLTILSVPLGQDEVERQIDLIRAHDLLIVNMIRDGRDVVHLNPKGPRVNVNRWIGCMLQAQLYRQLLNIQVRYEDLVFEPDIVQSRLCEVLGLVPVYKFSKYPDFVPDAAFDELEYREFANYNKRKISAASIGHSKTEYHDRCKSPEQRMLFERTLQRYGYLEGIKEEVWEKETLYREIENHKQDSIRLFF